MWYKQIPAEVPGLLNELFPEGKSPFPGFTTENVFVKCLNPEADGCWIDVTWLIEGAGYRNVFGYYYFDPVTGKIVDNKLYPLSPDTSKKGSKGCQYVGDTVRIDHVPYLSVVGFWLCPDCADFTQLGKSSNGAGGPWYSVTAYDINGGLRNPDGTNGDGYDTKLSTTDVKVPTRHFGWVKLSSDIEGLDNLIIFGTEDLNNLGDRDWNDVMFALEIGPTWNSEDILTYDPETKIIFKDLCKEIESAIIGPDFTATVSFQDPNMAGTGYSGVTTGTMTYSWAYGAYKIDVNSEVGKLHTFDTHCTRDHDGEYLYGQGKCGCEETFIGNNQPQLFFNANSDYYNPTYTTTTLNGQTVRVYQQNAPVTEAIKTLYLLDSDPTVVVRAVWLDGRIMDFTNFKIVNNINYATVFDETKYSCTCARPLDLVILAERSATIANTQMEGVKKFLRGDPADSTVEAFIDDFTISSTSTRMAVMSYDKTTKTHLPFSDGHVKSNVVTGINDLGCSSAACGTDVGDLAAAITSATAVAVGSGRNVPKAILVVTNGFYPSDSYKLSVRAAVDAANAQGVKVYTVFYESQNTVADLKWVAYNDNPDFYVVRYNQESLVKSDPIDISSRLCSASPAGCGTCCGFCDETCGICYPVDKCDVPTPDCNNPVVLSGTCCAVVPSVNPCNSLAPPANALCDTWKCGTDGKCQQVPGCVADKTKCETAVCKVTNGVASCVKTPMQQDAVCLTKVCDGNGGVTTKPLCPPEDACYKYDCANNVCTKVFKGVDTACTKAVCASDGKSIINQQTCRVETTPCYIYSCNAADGKCVRTFRGNAKTAKSCAWDECSGEDTPSEKLVQVSLCNTPSDACYKRYCDATTATAVCKSDFLGVETPCTYQECDTSGPQPKLSAALSKCPPDDECYHYTCDSQSGVCTKNFLGKKDKCTEEVCVNGKLVKNDLCTTPSDACYERGCDLASGCTQDFLGETKICTWDICGVAGDGTTPALVQQTKDCSGEANECFTAACVEGTGCVTTPVADPNTNKCKIGSCDPAKSPAWQYTDVDCTSKDACFTGTCDPQTGKCGYTASVLAQSCQNPTKGLCDLSFCKDGACVPTYVQCVDDPTDCLRLDTVNFPDTNGCNPASGECVQVPIKCAPDGCIDMTCSATSGTEGCVEESQERCACDCTNNACVQSTCDQTDPNNPICNPQPTDCAAQRPDFCHTFDKCDPVQGCLFTPVNCQQLTNPGKCDVVTKDPTNVDCCVTTPKTCTNDNPDCFTVACNPDTGDCDKTSRCAAPANACQIVKCTPGCNKAKPSDSCCEVSNVVCDSPPNKCYVGVCELTGLNAGKCRYDLAGCDDKDPCTIDECNPDTGACTHTAKNCDDGLPCTVDSCNPTTGICGYTPTPCPDDNDKCTNEICDAVTGCGQVAVQCDDNNPCTVDTCDKVKGCVYTPMACSDNDLCTRDTCVAGKCVFTAKSCDDSNACTIDTCDSSTGLCKNTHKDCDDSNPCTNDSCGADGSCVHAEIVCNDGNKCTTDKCEDGECLFTAVVCDDKDACTVDKCNLADGECVFTPVNCDDGNLCTNDSCVEGACQNLAIECELDGDLCTVDVCVEGKCETTNTDCDDGSKCTINTCDSESGGCLTEVVNCDDGVDCTEDTCEPETGCVHTPLDALCDRGDACSTEVCDLTEGCVSTPVVCEDDGDFCTEQHCQPFVGCQISTVDCSGNVTIKKKDEDCAVVYCDADKSKCDYKRLECALPAEAVVAGSAVGAAVVVGIVVGVIVALACAGGGVYAVLNATGKDEEAPVTNNPLYESADVGGDNVLYISK